MPHRVVPKYLSSKTNFVFNQTLFMLFRGRCRNDTFKLLFKTLLRELTASKGEILFWKSVKPCKKGKNSRAYYARSKDKSGSNCPPFQGNVQIPPSPGTMHSQMPGGRMLKLQVDQYINSGMYGLWPGCSKQGYKAKTGQF